MTKFATGVLIIFLAIYGLFKLWSYWDDISNDRIKEKTQINANAVIPEQLPGVPSELEASLKTAQNHGIPGLREWLRVYGPKCEDPRKGWIELDLVVLLSREEPAEARKLFASVQSRIPEKSPIYPRIKELAKTYQ